MIPPAFGFVAFIPKFKKDPDVAEIISVSINDLLDDHDQTLKMIKTVYMRDSTVPCYQFKEYIVWGAIVMILVEIKELLKRSIHK